MRRELRVAFLLPALGAALATAFALGVQRGRDLRGLLLQTDRDFDEATARQGVDGWVSFFAGDGIMMPAGGEMVVGQAAIRKFAAEAFTPGYTLRWEPMDAEVSGDLGYTYGVYKSTRPGADGKTETAYGKYVTVWRRQPDKAWKIAIDIGNRSPEPKK